jgi:hypothetical protein
MCFGGPALIYYVTPTEEELFSVGQSWTSLYLSLGN